MEEELLRLPRVKEMSGLSKSSIYEGMAAGTFPKKIKNGRCSLWVKSEIQEWIKSFIATQRAA